MPPKRISKRLLHEDPPPPLETQKPAGRAKRTPRENTNTIAAFTATQEPITRVTKKRPRSKTVETSASGTPVQTTPKANAFSVVEISSPPADSSPPTVASSPALPIHKKPREIKRIAERFDPDVLGPEPHKVALNVKVEVDGTVRPDAIFLWKIDINNDSENKLLHMRMKVLNKYITNFQNTRQERRNAQTMEGKWFSK